MPQIEITLDQMRKFVRDISGFHKPIINRALIDTEGVLRETLENDVFTNHNDTVEIPTKDDLRKHIKGGGSNHNPPRTPKKGKSYNQEYLDKKRRLGENKPHKYMEYGFWHGIDIRKKYGSVVMEAKPPETSEKGNRYMVLHERNRSVLKLAFLRGWQKIIDTIVKRLAKEAKA